MFSNNQANLSQTTCQTAPDPALTRLPRIVMRFERREKQYRPDVTITSQFVSHNITEVVIHKHADGHTTKSNTNKYKGDYSLIQELRNKWADKKQEFWAKNSVEILVHFKALDTLPKDSDLSNAEKARLIAEDQKNILRQIKNLGAEFKKYCKNVSVSIRFPASTATEGTVKASDLAVNPIMWLVQDVVTEMKTCEAVQIVPVKLIVPQFHQNRADRDNGVPIVNKYHVHYASPFKGLEAPQKLLLFQQNGMDGKPVPLHGEVIHHLNVKAREVNNYRKQHPEANGTHVVVTKKNKAAKRR